MGNDWYTTDFKAKPVRNRRTVMHVQHCLVLSMLICVMLAIFVPLWQRGVHRALEVEYQSLIENRQVLEEKTQVLRASISTLSMPEALLAGSWEQDVAFQPIKAEAVVRLARR